MYYKRLPVALFAAFAAVLLMAAVCLAEVQAVVGAMPETLAGMKRIQLITGREALRMVNELHGKALDLESCAIAFYGEPGSKTQVWISRGTEPEGSKEQTLLMVERMGKGRGPFSGPEVLDAGGVSVYLFQGMGQEHYLFYKGELAYWISAPMGLKAWVLKDFF